MKNLTNFLYFQLAILKFENEFKKKNKIKVKAKKLYKNALLFA